MFKRLNTLYKINQIIKFKSKYIYSPRFLLLPPRQFFRHLCVEEAQRASSLISILIEVFSKSAPIILICNIVISVDLLLLIRTREIDRYGLFRYNERRHTFSTQLITETMDKYCECEKYFFNYLLKTTRNAGFRNIQDKKKFSWGRLHFKTTKILVLSFFTPTV